MFDLKPKKKSNEFFELFETSADYFYQGALLLDEVMMDHRTGPRFLFPGHSLM